ncbi:MAG: hypothetical protein VX777_06730 [Chlamydiota bacterium]|nr:hypothetical protein [Chlamydiota bacterium]
MGINADPSGVSGGGHTFAPTTTGPTQQVSSAELPVDERGQSSLSKSSEQPLVIEFVASLPNLSVSTQTGLYSSALSSAETLAKGVQSISQSYNDAVNQMLDDWNEQIQIQAQIAKESAIKKAAQDSVQSSQRNQAKVVKDSIESGQIQTSSDEKAQLRDLALKIGDSSSDYKEVSKGIDTNFVTNWKKLSQTQRNQFRDIVGQHALKQYRSNYKDPVEINEDVKKLVPVLTALLTTEVFEINPLAKDISMRPLGGGSDSTGLPELLASTPGISQQIPQVNLMVPLPVYSTAVEASLDVFKKHRGNEGNVSSEKVDEEFVQEFAKKALEKTQDMSKFMAAMDPQYLLLPEAQKQTVNAMASMVTLTTVLVFDVKSQAQFSNLSPEEFASILKNGIPENDLLNTVVQQLNVSLMQIPDKNQRADFVSFLLDFIDRSRSSTVSDLKSFANALLYATQTIGADVRAVNTPD